MKNCQKLRLAEVIQDFVSLRIGTDRGNYAFFLR